MQRVAQARLSVMLLDWWCGRTTEGTLERAWATGPHLVAEEIAEQSSSTVGQYAQTMLVRCDSRKVWQVRRVLSRCFLSNAAQR